MARNNQTITIEQAKVLAAKWEAQYEEHLQAAAIAERFTDATPAEVIRMYESGRKEKGQKLSQSEFAALVERWLELFGAYPPAEVEPDGSSSQAAPEPRLEPQADDMLNSHQVVRLTGLSLSTIKRRVADGTFPNPMHLSPRRIGWTAREVKAWVKRLDDQRNATRQ